MLYIYIYIKYNYKRKQAAPVTRKERYMIENLNEIIEHCTNKTTVNTQALTSLYKLSNCLQSNLTIIACI